MNKTNRQKCLNAIESVIKEDYIIETKKTFKYYCVCEKEEITIDVLVNYA